jgi:hypothetical protein
MPKMPKKNVCETCNFICYKKSNYDKHLTTRKHKNLTNPNNLGIEVGEKIICNKCNKIYKHISTLSAHKKKCVVKNDYENTDYKINLLIKENTDFKNIILDMIKNNNESQKHSNEIQEKMIEVCKTNNITNSNSNNTMVNSNNKTFNLQVFLNEQCKDAMNLSDFMESIQLSLTDLENMDKLGYVECMFKNIFGNMDFISIFARPFHCSDFKRGIIYIKENGVWEKEDAGHSKIINAIRTVEKKNFKLLKEWSEKYPSFSDYNSSYNDKYLKIYSETMSGDKHNLTKLIRKLSKSCVIDKSNL